MAAFAVTAQAQAATLTVSPRSFSPHRALLQVSAKLSVERQVGVRLVTLRGRAVGWIVAPSRRRILAVGWDGRIGGKRVRDGNYIVRLVYRSAVLATAPVRVDGHAPQLVQLHADNGSTRFAGDGPLLTTISPNGDGFRDRADVNFSLREQATVTMEVTRTVKVPKVVYTITARFGKKWYSNMSRGERAYGNHCMKYAMNSSA